jgi:tetratricopeptide (TPR) repeat protein
MNAMLNQNKISAGLKFSAMLILTVLLGCSTTKQDVVSAQPKGKTKSQSPQISPDDMYLYVNAAKAKVLGNLDDAAGMFAECIRRDGNNHAAMYELADIYVRQKKYSDALFFARSASAANPHNPWYKELLAEVHENLKQYTDAANVYAQLAKEYPTRGDYYLNWAHELMQANNGTEAIKVYDKIEEQFGVNREVSLQKQRMYMDMGKPDKAAAEVMKLITQNPQDAQLYGILAEIYQAQKEYDKALEAYDKLKAIDPDNPYLHLSLADYYRNKGDNENSFKELKLAFENKELDLDTKLQIIASYYTLFELHEDLQAQAIELSEALIKAHPEESKVYGIHGDFLVKQKKYDEARTNYRKALKLDSSSPFELYKNLLFLDQELNDWDAIKADSKEVMDKFPNQPLPYLFSGFAQSRTKQYREAIESFNAGLKLVIDDKNLEKDFYSNLGDNYNNLKEYAKSDEAYDKALKIDSADSYVLNNYSYYLSLRNEKLNKAEDMSRLANQISPANASFEDTFGWILYKEGKYDEAAKWIYKAMGDGAEKNATILEHMGDIQYKMGNTDKALEYWLKAKEAGSNDASELLDKKIKDKKLYE